MAVVLLFPTKRFSVFGREDEVPYKADVLSLIQEVLSSSSSPLPSSPPEQNGGVKKVLVIDNGSFETRAGMAAEPTPKRFLTMTGRTGGKTFVGWDAIQRHRAAPDLTITLPIQRGLITNWEEMMQVWSATFYSSADFTKDCLLLLTEPIANPKANRERICEILFDTFQVEALYLCTSAVLAMEAVVAHAPNANRTGLVVECGHGLTQIVPVYEGYVLMAGVKHSPLAGMDLDEALQHHLLHAYFLPLHDVRAIKHELGYVALDFEREMQQSSSEVAARYTLPDGTGLEIAHERFQFAELLFNPALFGMETMPALQELIVESVAETDLFEEMLGNVVLSGNTALLPGFHARLLRELSASLPQMHIGLSQPMQDQVWHGGAILGANADFQRSTMPLRREEYHELGAEAVLSKCCF